MHVDAQKKASWAMYFESETAQGKINCLEQLGIQYFKERKNRQGDSCYAIAVNCLKKNTLQKCLSQLASSYLLFGIGGKCEDLSNEVFEKASKSSDKEFTSLAYLIKYRVLNETNPSSDSLPKILERINYYGSLTENYKIKSLALLDNSIALSITGDKILAYESCLDAIHLAKKNKDFDLEYKARIDLTSLLNRLNYIDLEEKELQNLSSILTTFKPIDSVRLMEVETRIIISKLNNGNGDLILERLGFCIEYGLRNNSTQLLKDLNLFLRNSCILRNRLDLLKEFYTRKYPILLSNLKVDDSLSFYRVKGLLMEVDHKKDSADYYFENLNNLVKQANKSDAYKCNHYGTYGQYLKRQNRIEEAAASFNLQFEFAKKSQYLPWIISSSKNLASIYEIQNDYQNGLKYAQLHNHYRDSLDENLKADELLKLNIDDEARKRALQEKQDGDELTRNHQIQNSAIVLLLLLSALLLFLFSSASVPIWLLKAFGYIFFIFFFEFIILLVDQKLHHFFHGAPLPIIGIKIVLIAILLPLHHKAEHKIIQYLRENEIFKPKIWWQQFVAYVRSLLPNNE
jgi:hypothetical protein